MQYPWRADVSPPARATPRRVKVRWDYSVWVQWDRGQWHVSCKDCTPVWLGAYSNKEAAEANAQAHRDNAAHLGMGVDSADP